MATGRCRHASRLVLAREIAEGGIEDRTEIAVCGVRGRNHTGLAAAFFAEAGSARIRKPDLHRTESGGPQRIPALPALWIDGHGHGGLPIVECHS
jgi:hypothetical protein